MIEGSAASLWAQVWDADPRHALLASALELKSLAAVMALAHLGCCIDPEMEAVLVPVGRAFDFARVIPDACSRCLMLADGHFSTPFDGFDGVSDVIAVPLDGGECLSLEGWTGAIGDFRVVEGRSAILASGINFLRRHAARAAAAEHDAPSRAAALGLPPPDYFETLLINRNAFEWRLSEQPIIVPSPDHRIACVDSRELAVWIGKALRERRPTRAAPKILMPKEHA